MSRPSLVVVLVEDRLQQSFVRRYLSRLGYRKGDHRIRFLPVPADRGCGEQYVRERYASEVEEFRTRSAKTALVVAIDADTWSVERRAEQLRLILKKAKRPARKAGERIAHLIPKRNIETWVLCLNGTTVDEETNYRRRRGIDEGVATAAVTFFDWSRPNAATPPHCIDSLRKAFPEVRRLD